MSAIRLARGFTGREKIIKFDGCYHGHADSLLVKAGVGRADIRTSRQAAAFRRHSRNIQSLFHSIIPTPCARLLRPIRARLRAVIVEPVPGNAGVYLPQPGFLEALREMTQVNGALLIFDEVMTGFRLAYGGAQSRFGIVPRFDLLRQDHRSRPAGGRVRRTQGNYGHARATWTSLPSGHIERKPAGDGRRVGGFGPTSRRECLSET